MNYILPFAGVFEHVLFAHSVGNFIIPTDEVMFFHRGRLNDQPDPYHRLSIDYL